VCIIGSGFVGMAVGTGLSSYGINVVFYDLDDSRIQQLRKANVKATSNLKSAVKDFQVSFICVPTPNKNGSIDLSATKSAVVDLASP